jgi:carboxypeptidase C (cathepsin A)
MAQSAKSEFFIYFYFCKTEFHFSDILQDVDPMTAPVVIWLQGGPGGSSMFGLLEIHGPFQSVFDGNGNVHAEVNPHAWTKEANVIYIDNPVGAGFSYSDKLPSTEEEVENDLYEFLIQWFQLFPQYQVST